MCHTCVPSWGLSTSLYKLICTRVLWKSVLQMTLSVKRNWKGEEGKCLGGDNMCKIFD